MEGISKGDTLATLYNICVSECSPVDQKMQTLLTMTSGNLGTCTSNGSHKIWVPIVCTSSFLGDTGDLDQARREGRYGVCWLPLFPAAAAAKSLQSCPTLCDPIDGTQPGSPHPWDSPGKSTGVGCHFFLQCMKVKSESEVAQPYPTLSDPMDCSLPGSAAHGIFQARVLEWGAIAFS